MPDHSSSFFDSVRSKFASRRSHSTPPGFDTEYRSANRPIVPAEHTHQPNPDSRGISSRTPQPTPLSTSTCHMSSAPYAKYDPRSYQTIGPGRQQAQSIPRRSVQPKLAPPSTPLLQLPRPRALWRRSLEDLSPTATRRTASWHEGDVPAHRLTVDLACALPPAYLDMPPDYGSVEEPSKTRRPNEWAGSLDGCGVQQRRKESLPQIITTAPAKEPSHGQKRDVSSMRTSPPQSLTVDMLLEHPLLR